MCQSRATRPVRASTRGELAEGPRSTRSLSDLTWLSSRQTRDTIHPTALDEAPLHRYRARSAAAASKRRVCRIHIPCCATRAPFDPWRIDPPPTEYAPAGGLGVVGFAVNAPRTPPHAVGRGSSSPTRTRSGAAALKYHGKRVQIMCHAARARFDLWRTGRWPTKHTLAVGLGMVVFAANARHAPPHAVG